MSISVLMLSSFMFGAPTSTPANSAPVLKLDKGMELTWRGTFSEAILRPNVRALRMYDVEARIFTLDVADNAADVALYTSITLKPDLKATPVPPPIVRLELLRIDARGKTLSLPHDALTQTMAQRKPSPLQPMTLEGLPTLDAALFLPMPEGKLEAAIKWDVAEDKRPPLKFKLEGMESMKGARAWRISGLQQTDDWEELKIDRAVWRRGESNWISAQYGWTMRAERTIEKRDPQSGDLGFRSKLEINHVGRMTYPGRLGEDRREEIAAALQFIAEYERIIPNAGRSGPEPFERLLRQIEQHNQSHFTGDSVPYREPIVWITRKTEAAKRGQIAPDALPPETGESTGLKVNRPAPDVTAIDLTNSERVRLNKLRSRPVVLMYYQPSSEKTAEPVLRLAQNLYTRYSTKAFILPMAIGASDVAIQQRNDLRLTVHVLGGRDVYRTHGIESTPTFVILDENGVVKRIVAGWSEENAESVRTELEKLLK